MATNDDATKVPTLYEWLGGSETLDRLISRFYEKVPGDELLAPVFARMPKEHFQHVADFLAEVFGGPAKYSAELGGHAAMVRHHLGRGITEKQRARWVGLLLETADEMKLPADPEFRSALVAYLEWGSRLAAINSAMAAGTALDEGTPMPKWGWGVPGGPFVPEP
jgi:hemoglobin